MSKKDIAYCDQLWENAKAQAQTQAQLDQLLRSELSWRYWKCANRKGEFSLMQFPYVWMNANECLYRDIKAMGIRVMSEGNNRGISDCELLYLYRHPRKWTTLFEEPYWDVLNPYAIKLYEFLGKIYNLFS